MRFSTRRIMPIVALIAAVALAVFAVAAPVQAQTPGGRLRIVHAVPSAPAVDVTVDGVVAAQALDYAIATRYLTITPGDHAITVAATGTTTPIFTGKVTVAATQVLTLVLQGTASAIEVGTFEDDLGPVAPGNTRLTAIHAIKDGPAVDVTRADGSPLVQGLKYGVPYGAFDIPATSANLLVIPTGGDASKAILKADNVSLVSGTHNTLLAVGTAAGTVQPSYILLSAATDSEAPAGSIFVSFANTIVGSDPVDVYVGDKLYVPGLAFGSATPHIAIDAKAAVTVRGLGSAADSTALAKVDSLGVAAGGAGTVVINGEAGALVAKAVLDNITALDPKVARVNIINATGAGKATITFADKALASDVAKGGSEVPSGIYDVTVTVDDPALSLTQKLPLSGGVLYDVIVAGGAGGKLIVNATGINEQVTSAPGASGAAVASAPTSAAPPATQEAAAIAPTEVVAVAPTATLVAPAAEPTVVAAAPTDVPVVAPTEAPVPTAEPAGNPDVVEAAVPDEATPAPAFVPDVVVGVVFNLNEGVNLKIREYPLPEARTLQLIPKDTQLVINGIKGPKEEIGQPTVVKTAGPTPTINAEGVDANTLWLNVTWQAPDGGSVTGWASAQFIRLSRNGKQFKDVKDILALRPVPENFPGEVNTSLVTPIFETNQLVATVNIDEGRNLQIRRTPGTDGESLDLAPTGTKLLIIAKTELKNQASGIGVPTNTIWLNVRFQKDNGAVVGWVNAEYVTIARNNRKIEMDEIPEAKEIERGFIEGDVTTQKAAAPAGLIATVDQINAGSNLQLRRDPNATAESIGLIPAAAQLTVLGRNGDGNWLQVQFEDKQGWIASQYVTLTKNGKKFNISEITNVTTETDIAAQITPGPSLTPTTTG